MLQGYTSPTRDTSRGFRAGFTLVELLVVIGIIAVLIGILLPALNRARAAANITKCTAAMKQVFVAAQLHAMNHKGYYPLAGRFDTPGLEPRHFNDSDKKKYSYYYYSGTGGANDNRFNLASWYAAVAQYMTKRRILDSQNNDDFIVDEFGDGDYLRFFICPAHVGRSDEVAPNDDEPWVHSYNVSASSISGFTAKSSFLLNEAVFGHDTSRRQLRGQSSKIKEPSRTMMLMDGTAIDHWAGGPNWGTVINAVAIGRNVGGRVINSFALSDAFGTGQAYLVRSKSSFDTVRHKGKVDILFMDGHAETRRIDAKDLADVFLLAPGTTPGY